MYVGPLCAANWHKVNITLLQNLNYNDIATEVKNKLRDILLWVNIAKIANHYFDKKSTWLYAKIDGESAEFKPDEVLQLKGALIDLAERIRCRRIVAVSDIMAYNTIGCTI